MASLKGSLKAAREAMGSKNFPLAMEHCKAALKVDAGSYEALLFLGKAAFLSSKHAEAEVAYKQASEVNKNLAPAWKGLAEVYEETQSTLDLIHVLENLLPLSKKQDSKEKYAELKVRLGKLYAESGKEELAVPMLQDVLGSAVLNNELQVTATCTLIDLKVEDDDEDVSDEVFAMLGKVQGSKPPCPGYAKYHDMWLKASYQRLAPPTKGANSDRKALFLACIGLIQKSSVGAPELQEACCSFEAYRLAILLAAQLHSSTDAPGICDKLLSRVETDFIHKFPWCDMAISLACMRLHQLFLARKLKPTSFQERDQLLQILSLQRLQKSGVDKFWSLAIELAVKNEKFKLAMDLSTAASKWREAQAPSQYCPDSQELYQIKILEADALLGLDDVASAKALYRSMADAAKSKTLDESFAIELTVRALLGMASCARQEGALESAKKLNNLVISKAGKLPYLLVLAKLELASCCFQINLLEEAQSCLQQVLKESKDCGGQVTDIFIGRAHLLLGKVYNSMGGTFQADRKYAHKQWLAAAALPGRAQAEAFAVLGSYYEETGKDSFRAAKCYERSIELDPQQASAGFRLVQCLMKKGDNQKARLLLQNLTSNHDDLQWAWVLYGRLLLSAGKHQEAVRALQTSLRSDRSNADAWEALGFAYHNMGRLTAAIKAYNQATSLDASKHNSWTQAGCIHLSMGATDDALGAFEAALEAKPDFLPANVQSAQALLSAARNHTRLGALGLAAKELQRAEQKMQAVSGQASNIETIWKLYGDIKALHFHVSQPYQAGVAGGRVKQDHLANNIADQWQRRVRQCKGAGACYSKALHLNPASASHWSDLAFSLSLQERLTGGHSPADNTLGGSLAYTTERLIKGGLRLDPCSPQLWSALGSTAKKPEVKQYAFSRALQLDPKHTPSWAALGRLYMDSRETDLAAQCFTQARSHEPTAAMVWESMGTLAGLSSTGKDERFEYYKHALQLGPGLESLLGYVEDSLRKGSGDSGSVLVAASRCCKLQPLNPAVHYAMALVCEAHGDVPVAIQHLKAALTVSRLKLPSKVDQGGEQKRVLKTTNTYIGGAVNGITAHVDEADKSQQHGATNITFKVALARLLAKAGDYKLAIQLYSQSSADSAVQLEPETLLWHGKALCDSGKTDKGIEILLKALNTTSNSKVYGELLSVACLRLVKDGRGRQGVQLLQAHFQELLKKHAESSTVHNCLLFVLKAVAASGGREEWQTINQLCQEYSRASDDVGGGEFKAAQLQLKARFLQRLKASDQAISAAISAVHLHPSDSDARILAAKVLLKEKPGCDFSRLLSSKCLLIPADDMLSGTPQGGLEGGVELASIAAVLNAQSLSKDQYKAACMILLKWLRADPGSRVSWLLLGLLDVYSMAESPDSLRLHRALRSLKASRQILGENSHDQMDALLLLGEAECHSLLSSLEDDESHLRLARDALSQAERASSRQEYKDLLSVMHSRLDGFPDGAKAIEQVTSEEQSSGKVQAALLVLISSLQTSASGGDDSLHTAVKACSNVTRHASGRMQVSLQIAMALACIHQKRLFEADELLRQSQELIDHSDMSVANTRCRPLTQVLLGIVSLMRAKEEDDPSMHMAEARSNLLAASRSCYRDAAVLASTCLAELESIGGHKKRTERMQGHVNKVHELCGSCVPMKLQAFLQPLATSSAS